MIRIINISRVSSVTRNLSLIIKRYQQSSTSLGSTSSNSTKSTLGSNTIQSSIKTQTASTTPSSNTPIDRTNNPTKTIRTSSSSSYTSTGHTGSTTKAIVYGVAFGLGITLLYAEYENGSFRRKVESTLPLSSTILSGLDKIINPLFGRPKKLKDIISEKLPDTTVITDKLPDKEQLTKTGEQAKNVATSVYNKLPSEKQIETTKERAKDFIHDTYEKLPDKKTVKKTFTDAKEKIEDTVKSVKDTVKSAIPTSKGVSGEPSRRDVEPVFLEEPGTIDVPPAIKRK